MQIRSREPDGTFRIKVWNWNNVLVLDTTFKTFQEADRAGQDMERTFHLSGGDFTEEDASLLDELFKDMSDEDMALLA